MIRQTINVDNYWKVIVYYDIDYNFFHYISDELRFYNCEDTTIEHIYKNMYSYSTYAFTYNSYKDKVSIVGFNKHKDYYEYINSIVHEAEHIKQAMLYVYNIEDYGEPPAYTVGYLVMQMFKVFKEIL